MIANDLTGAVPVFPSVGASRESSALAEPGTVHLAVPYTGQWKVTVGGTDVPARPAFGLTNAYDIAGTGTLEVRFASSVFGSVVSAAVMVLWMAVLWVALPRRRRAARRTVSVAPQDGAISFGGGEQ